MMIGNRILFPHWIGDRIIVRGAVGLGVNQSMCSLILNLPPVLLQEEDKNLSHHRCQCVITIGLLKCNSYIIILQVDREISVNLMYRCLIFGAESCVLLWWLFMNLILFRGSTQPLMKMSTRNISRGEGSRCVRLIISLPSCAEYHGNLGP